MPLKLLPRRAYSLPGALPEHGQVSRGITEEKNGIGLSLLCPKTAQKCAEQHSFLAAEGMLAQINYHSTWSGCRGLGAAGKQMAALAQRAKVTQVVLLEIYYGPFKPRRNSQFLCNHSCSQSFYSLGTSLLASTRKALPYGNVQLNMGHGGTSRRK